MTTEAKTINHYGRFISPEVPTGGVVQVNEISSEFLNDMMMDGINVSFEAFIEDNGEAQAEFFEQQPDDEILVGFIKDEITGEYREDDTQPFSCVILESTIHIIRSIYVTYGEPCSPCCPGQVSIGEEGSFLAYSLPAEAYTDSYENEYAITPPVYVYKPKKEWLRVQADIQKCTERIRELRKMYTTEKKGGTRHALQRESSYLMLFRQYSTELSIADRDNTMVKQRTIP